MLAVLLLAGIFLCATTIGFAVVSALNARRTLLLNVLVSPAVGFCVVVLPTQFLNRLGLPVNSFATVLVLLEFVLAVVILWRTKPVVPWRVLWPFGLILIAAFLLTCMPLAQYGFGWVSYGSSDMTFYALNAQYFARNAYYAVPAAGSVQLKDVEPWRVFVMSAERSGVEQLLATVISITKLRGVEAFMPLNCAGYLALVLSTAALCARRSARPLRSYAVAAAIALSPLTTLGFLEQLLGQVFGLAVCAALVALLFDDRFYRRTPRGTAAGGTLAGSVAAGLVAIYPELLPFFGIAFAAYLVLALRRHAVVARTFGRMAAWTALPSAVFLNVLFLRMMELIANRSASADRRRPEGSIFPYFLVPNGFANFWGFVPIPLLPAEPKLSLLIGAGIVLSAVLLAVALVAAWQRSKAALVACTMLAGAVYLFAHHVDYGLYKLAMFAQPFVLATLIDVRAGARRAWLPIAATLAICLAGLPAQRFYLSVSQDGGSEDNGSFASIPAASIHHFVQQLDDLKLDRSAPFIVSDSASRSLQVLEASFTDRPIAFAADDVEMRIGRITPRRFGESKDIAIDRRLVADIGSTSRLSRFAFHGKHQIGYFYAIDLARLERPGIRPWLLSNQSTTILNGLGETVAPGKFAFRPMDQVSNHLNQVDASLARIAGYGFSHVAIFDVEPDYFFRHSRVAGLGQYVLLKVTNPTPRIRLEIDLSTSEANDGVNALPPLKVIGRNSLSLDVAGRGSARLFSAPFEPRIVSGERYVGLDLGRGGKPAARARTGLMRLFGNDESLDPRRVVAYGRDISVVPDAAYSGWTRPPGVSSFPADLANPHLEYSGMFEDGWASEHAYFVLQATSHTRRVFLSGFVPSIADPAFATRLGVTVDGKAVLGATLAPGTFAFDPPVRLTPGPHHIGLTFSRAQSLPLGDKRLVGAHLSELSLDASQQEIARSQAVENGNDIVAEGGCCRLGANWYALEHYGGETFRWFANDAVLYVDARAAGRAKIAVTVEPGPGTPDGRLGFSLRAAGGAQVASARVNGRTTLQIALPVRPGSNEFHILVSGGGRRIPSDPRVLDARIFKIAGAPEKVL
jgi:hypothetical protein